MEKNNSKKTVRLVLCALFAALIAVGAFIKIPIPYIPLTLRICCHWTCRIAGVHPGRRHNVCAKTHLWLLNWLCSGHLCYRRHCKQNSGAHVSAAGRRKLGRPCDYLSVWHGLLFSNQPSVPWHKHHHSEFVFILLFGNNPRRCYLVSCCRSNRKAAEPNNEEICGVSSFTALP